jgi:hypothetical protein
LHRRIAQRRSLERPPDESRRTYSIAVRLEFVVRLRLRAGPNLGSGRPTAHGSDRQRPPSVHCRRPTACDPPMMRDCAPCCSRSGVGELPFKIGAHSRTAHGREILVASSRSGAPRMGVTAGHAGRS